MFFQLVEWYFMWDKLDWWIQFKTILNYLFIYLFIYKIEET